jgi:hypothetical protein
MANGKLVVVAQDTDGVWSRDLDTGELGYDNFPAGGDAGRLYVGDGAGNNIPQATKEEVDEAMANAVSMAIALG